jgi:two-component system nitrate/nitrite response regulator NarL
MATLTLLIASEVRFLRESLAEILGRDGNAVVVGQCADASRTFDMTRDLCPDMVILDAALPDGLSLARRLHSTQGGPRVVAFAVSESIETVLAWAEAGVVGYIPSTAAMNDLQTMIADIDAGRQACTGAVAAGLLRRIGASPVPPGAPAPADAPSLTAREFEIVRLISAGLSNKEIARRLNIGLATTKSHVHNVLAKLNMQRRTQAATWMHAHSRLA